MPERARLFAVAVMAGLAAALAVCAPAAEAARAPTDRELRAIKAGAMSACRSQQPPCQWLGSVIVSTVDPRYAWAASVGAGYSTEGVLRRSRRSSRRWRPVAVVGGSVQDCGYWLRESRAPAKVLADLVVVAARLPEMQEVICGPRLPELRERRCGVTGTRQGRTTYWAAGMSCRKARNALKTRARSAVLFGARWKGWRYLSSDCEGMIVPSTNPSALRTERLPRVSFQRRTCPG